MDYDSLGTLMNLGLRHRLEYRPKEAIAKLKAGTLFKEMMETAKHAQEQLYASAETDADMAFLWSDLKWESGLFPPEEPKVTEKAQKEARQWVTATGGWQPLLDKTLKEANLGYCWNPSNRVSWTEEMEEMEQQQQ